jgi:hypothetical protein
MVPERPPQRYLQQKHYHSRRHRRYHGALMILYVEQVLLPAIAARAAERQVHPEALSDGPPSCCHLPLPGPAARTAADGNDAD